MVRSISAASQAKLDQNLGTEPALIIEIQWVDGGSIYKYADKNLGGTEGKILNVSGLDNTVVVQSVQSGTSSDSQAISVTLDEVGYNVWSITDNDTIQKFVSMLDKKTLVIADGHHRYKTALKYAFSNKFINLYAKS